jgi:hypothetical protein
MAWPTWIACVDSVQMVTELSHRKIRVHEANRSGGKNQAEPNVIAVMSSNAESERGIVNCEERPFNVQWIGIPPQSTYASVGA